MVVALRLYKIHVRHNPQALNVNTSNKSNGRSLRLISGISNTLAGTSNESHGSSFWLISVLSNLMAGNCYDASVDISDDCKFRLLVFKP